MSPITVHYRVSVYRLFKFMFHLCHLFFSGTGYVLSTPVGVVYLFAYFSFYFWILSYLICCLVLL